MRTAVTNVEYSLTDGELIVINRVSGERCWRGTFDGGVVERLIEVEEDCVVVIGSPKVFKDRNLLRVREDGMLVWRAESPPSFEGYVSAAFVNGSLFANSWSGYRLQLDVSSGKIVSREFTK